MILVHEAIRIFWDIVGLIALVGVVVLVYGALEGIMGPWDRFRARR